MHHNYFNFLNAQSIFKWRIFDSFSAVSAFEQGKFMKIHGGLFFSPDLQQHKWKENQGHILQNVIYII